MIDAKNVYNTKVKLEFEDTVQIERLRENHRCTNVELPIWNRCIN